MKIERFVQGKNSILYDSESKSVLYEKLSDTIHTGKRGKLECLQKRVESIDYKPIFETESLMRGRDAPLTIMLLEVTEQCNLDCSYCIYSANYPNERRPSRRQMTFEVAKKAIDELVPLSRKDISIGFYGGEPLLNMGLIRQVIGYSKKSFPSKDISFSMTTNFVNAGRHIREIVDIGFFINLSLDGPREIHDKCRRTKEGAPTFDRIMSNLEKIERHFPGYTGSHIFVLSMCDDPNDLPQILQFFDKGDYFVTRINSPEPKGRIQQEKGKSAKHMIDTLVEEFRKRILSGEDPKILRRLFDEELKVMALRDGRVMPQRLMLNGSCYPGRKRIFVDVYGNYHPCERFGRRLKIGSVKNGVQQNRIDWAIETFANIRNSLCRECWAQRVCTPCLQHAKDPEGEISLEGLSQTCEGKRKELLTGLDNYINLIDLDKARAEKYIKDINPLFERRIK